MRSIAHHLDNPLKAELNPICYLLALLGAHHFLHVSRIRDNQRNAVFTADWPNITRHRHGTNRQEHQQHLKAAHLSAPVQSHLHNSLTDFYGTRIHVKNSLVKYKCLRWGIQYSRPNIINRQPTKISSRKPKLLDFESKSIRKTSFNIIWLFTYSLFIQSFI